MCIPVQGGRAVASAQYQSFAGKKVAVWIIPEVDGNGIETAFVMASFQDFGRDGKEFAFVVRGAAAFCVPPHDRRPEDILFSVYHADDVWLYIVISLQGNPFTKICISLNTFVVVFQAPLSVFGSGQKRLQLFALDGICILCKPCDLFLPGAEE